MSKRTFWLISGQNLRFLNYFFKNFAFIIQNLNLRDHYNTYVSMFFSSLAPLFRFSAKYTDKNEYLSTKSAFKQTFLIHQRTSIILRCKIIYPYFKKASSVHSLFSVIRTQHPLIWYKYIIPWQLCTVQHGYYSLYNLELIEMKKMKNISSH